MKNPIKLLATDGYRIGDYFTVDAAEIVRVTPKKYGGGSFVSLRGGSTLDVADAPDSIDRLINEFNERENVGEQKKTAVADYLELRIEHLRERHTGGDQLAHVRLTEVEAMRDFLKKTLQL